MTIRQGVTWGAIAGAVIALPTIVVSALSIRRAYRAHS